MSSESEDKAKQQAMIVQKERAIEQNYRAFKKLDTRKNLALSAAL